MWESTKRDLEIIFRSLVSTGKPFIIAGDFNVGPETMQKCLLDMHIPANIVTSGNATCHSGGTPSCIDYFVIH